MLARQPAILAASALFAQSLFGSSVAKAAESSKPAPSAEKAAARMVTNAASPKVIFDKGVFGTDAIVQATPGFQQAKLTFEEVWFKGSRSKSLMTFDSKQPGNLQFFFHIDARSTVPGTLLVYGSNNQLVAPPFFYDKPHDKFVWKKLNVELAAPDRIRFEFLPWTHGKSSPLKALSPEELAQPGSRVKSTFIGISVSFKPNPAASTDITQASAGMSQAGSITRNTTEPATDDIAQSPVSNKR